MSEKDEETFKSVDLEQQTQKSPEPDIHPQQPPSETDNPSTPSAPSAPPAEAKAETTPSARTSAVKAKWKSSAEQFKVKRFFVLRVMSILFILFFFFFLNWSLFFLTEVSVFWVDRMFYCVCNFSDT